MFSFSIPIATFWYKHCLGANTVPLWSKASKFTKFSYSAPYGSAWNRVTCRTWRSVRLLHRKSDYIFSFSIPLATFWYKHCLGAKTEPLWSIASKFTKFPYSTQYGRVETGWFSGRYRSARLLHRESDYNFRFSTPIATSWYKPCFGAITVRLWLKAWNFTKFLYSAPYGDT